MTQLVSAMTQVGVHTVPSKGNFILLRVGEAEDAGMQVFNALLARGVITRPVANYDLPQWLRVSIGTHAENERFIAAMTEVLPALAARIGRPV